MLAACGFIFAAWIMVSKAALDGGGRIQNPGTLIWLGGFVLMSALSYVLNFRLQGIAGPVVFSQIGYWGIGFGVLLAAILFRDVLTALSLAGLSAIVCGGVLANQRR